MPINNNIKLRHISLLGFGAILIIIVMMLRTAVPQVHAQTSNYEFLRRLPMPWLCTDQRAWQVTRTIWMHWYDSESADTHAPTNHLAIDFNLPGTDDLDVAIVAPADGTTEYFQGRGYGNGVRIKTDQGWTITFLHIAEASGPSQVRRGQIVARVGAYAGGSHLHVEISPDWGQDVSQVQWLFGHPISEFGPTKEYPYLKQSRFFSNICGEGGPQTTLYWHRDYGGEWFTFYGFGTFGVPKWFNDQASSVRRSNGAQVNIFEHSLNDTRWPGASALFFGDDPNFEDNVLRTSAGETIGLNDNGSSLRVEPSIACPAQPVGGVALLAVPGSDTSQVQSSCVEPTATPVPGGPGTTPMPTPGDWWLLEFSQAQVSPFETQLKARTLWTSDFDAMRLCFNGANCQETSATELYYVWLTYPDTWPDNVYTLSVEYRRKSDGGNWANALRYEIAYALSEHRPGFGACDGSEGIYLYAADSCIRTWTSQPDLSLIGMSDRSGLEIAAVGNVEAIAYDGPNYDGYPHKIASGQRVAVGSNVSSVRVQPATPPPAPLPTEPWVCDPSSIIFHFDEGTGNRITDSCRGLTGTVDPAVSWVLGWSGTGLQFVNPPDGRGIILDTPSAYNQREMTVDMWVLPQGEGRLFSILGGGPNSGSNRMLVSIQQGKVKLEVWTQTGGANTWSYRNIETGAWSLITVNYNADTRIGKLYLNNELVGQLMTDAPWPLTDTTVEIGAGEAIYRSSAIIDEVRISTVARDPEPAVAPVADFSFTPGAGAAPLAVTFSDHSTGAVTSWLWLFGDGSTSTEQNPVHWYNTPGTYTPQLTVTGPGGTHTYTSPVSIVVEVTATPTPTSTPTATATSTPSATASATATSTATSTPTATLTPTTTLTPTATPSVTPTATPSESQPPRIGTISKQGPGSTCQVTVSSRIRDNAGVANVQITWSRERSGATTQLGSASTNLMSGSVNDGRWSHAFALTNWQRGDRLIVTIRATDVSGNTSQRTREWRINQRCP